MKNPEFHKYILDDIQETQQAYLTIKYQEFLAERSQHREAYVLRLVTKKKTVVCEHCHELGHVCPHCSRCGGRGTHYKSYQCYEVSPRKIQIVKTDREPENGKLRYWTSMSEFYYDEIHQEDNKYIKEYPHGVHLVHFNLQEAQNEANRLNEIRMQRGEM
jgi:RecJ-like exonuclease